MKESARTALSWFRAQRAALRRRSGVLQGRGNPPARAVRRDSEGRAVGRRHDGHGAGLGADRAPVPRRPGDDRRDHAVGPRAAGRRHQGEGARGPASRHHRSDPAAAEREEHQGGSDRGAPPRADDPLRGAHRGSARDRAACLPPRRPTRACRWKSRSSRSRTRPAAASSNRSSGAQTIKTRMPFGSR